MSAGAPVLEVRELSKRYGAVTALDGISFMLDAGTVTGFLGPNGAGKTTTLRIATGLARPSSGEALISGRHYAELVRPIQHVGAVLESGGFDPGRSGRNHLRIQACAGAVAHERIDEVLELVDLVHAADRPVRGYSLGMRQRLALATALLGEPVLLLLDEPTSGLDPAGIHWLRTFLREFARAGGAVLVSSHVLAEVAQTVDEILIIDRGRLVEQVSVSSLQERGTSLEDLYLRATTRGRE